MSVWPGVEILSLSTIQLWVSLMVRLAFRSVGVKDVGELSKHVSSIHSRI